ncbi:hypothetical protein [uncultured Corynebacterium sp.]|uniref:hypothetical protein n=1 Tax=uncultured Corynebacterium sp. TaxID=159447 RepID=UPI0025ECEB98|nr:hypothetical protein [uncultured Corynebacterium sp.]
MSTTNSATQILWASSGLSTIAALICGGLLVFAGNGGDSSSNATSGEIGSDADNTTADEVFPSGPLITVDSSGDSQGFFADGGLQRWADAVNANDLDTLLTRCDLYPESYIRSHYLENKDRIAPLLESGSWDNGNGLGWGESSSDPDYAFADNRETFYEYSCPKITLAGVGDPPDDLLVHAVRREILDARGTPVSFRDEDDYDQVACTDARRQVNTDIHNLDKADPEDIAVVSGPDKGAWTVTAGPVTFTVMNTLSQVCIDRAR